MADNEREVSRLEIVAFLVARERQYLRAFCRGSKVVFVIREEDWAYYQTEYRGSPEQIHDAARIFVMDTIGTLMKT